jgi:hypothetical protein
VLPGYLQVPDTCSQILAGLFLWFSALYFSFTDPGVRELGEKRKRKKRKKWRWQVAEGYLTLLCSHLFLVG